MEQIRAHPTYAILTKVRKRAKESSNPLSDDKGALSTAKLYFFGGVVAILNTTLIVEAFIDLRTNQSIRWFVFVMGIYLLVIGSWFLASRLSGVALTLLHVALLVVTCSSVHIAGGALSVSGVYFIFLAVVTGLLVLDSEAGLVMSITCGLGYLILAVLELGGVLSVKNPIFSPLYRDGFSYLAIGQILAASTVCFFSSALARLIASSIKQSSMEKEALYDIANRSRLEWEATFAAIDDGISVHDERLCFIHANKAMSGLLGRSGQDLRGQRAESVFDGWFLDKSPLKKCQRSGRRETSYVDDPPGQTGNFRIVAYPLDNHDGRTMGVVQIIQDITAEKRVQSQLAQTEKLAALGCMVASLAHEINNPLQALNTGLHLLKKPSLSVERRERYINVASDEVNRLIAVTSGMLDFYRPSIGKKIPTDLNSLLEDVLILTEKTLRDHGVQPSVEYERELPQLEIVADQFKQVFVNLVLNAMEAMPNGGRLLISTCKEEDKNGNEITISFADTGIGISSEILDKVFDPFFTTKESGTGMGLSLCYRIVEQHGGRIQASSHNGAGSTFTVHLPLSACASVIA